HNGHTGVGLNAYVGDSTGPGNWSGPFGHVVVNAGRWLANCQGTPTPTPTVTVTPTPTVTVTPTPTVTVTPTPTVTVTPTPTVTVTPTPTPTPIRPTPTPRPRPTPWPRPTQTCRSNEPWPGVPRPQQLSNSFAHETHERHQNFRGGNRRVHVSLATNARIPFSNILYSNASQKAFLTEGNEENKDCNLLEKSSLSSFPSVNAHSDFCTNVRPRYCNVCGGFERNGIRWNSNSISRHS